MYPPDCILAHDPATGYGRLWSSDNDDAGSGQRHGKAGGGGGHGGAQFVLLHPIRSGEECANVGIIITIIIIVIITIIIIMIIILSNALIIKHHLISHHPHHCHCRRRCPYPLHLQKRGSHIS